MVSRSPSSTVELDAQLLARAQGGDRKAAGAFVTVYQGAVFALLSRMLVTGPESAACEDLAQETFIRALRALPRFDPAGPARLSTWLLTIAARLAINELERREIPLTTDAILQSPAAPTGLHPAERRQIARALERALGELGPSFRAAFLLREMHDLSYAEIAGALEIDIGTVRSRLARARARLQAALADFQESLHG